MLTVIKEESFELKTFGKISLNEQLMKCINTTVCWSNPTTIQDQLLKPLTEGNDLLVQSGSGTGKTSSYAIAIINQLLDKPKDELNTFALVLAATKEMCSKAHEIFSQLIELRKDDYYFLDLNDSTFTNQKRFLQLKPQVIISTPTLILEHLKAKNVELKETLKFLILDEVDLLLESNYINEFKELLCYLPTDVQSVFYTKIINEKVKIFSDLILKNGYKKIGSISKEPVFKSMEKNVSPRKLNKMKLNSRDEIQKKLDKVDKSRRHKCQYCEAAFKKYSNKKVHERIHTGEKPFECKYCDKTFAQSNNKKEHERIHTGEKPFKCNFCDAAFTTSGSKTKHKRIHTGEKPFKCQYCDSVFSDSSSKTRHERIHTTAEKTYKCQYCEAVFLESSEKTRHEEALHYDLIKDY